MRINILKLILRVKLEISFYSQPTKYRDLIGVEYILFSNTYLQ